MCGVRERDLGPEQLENRMVINWDGEDNKFGNSYQQPILDVDFKWPFDIQVDMSERLLDALRGEVWAGDIHLRGISV